MNMLPPKFELKKSLVDAVEKAEIIKTAKKYPVHTALAIGAIGVFAGLFFVRKKSKLESNDTNIPE